jgi:hypothetical protein
MKTSVTVFVFLLVFMFTLSAQNVPQGINYQAAARNSQGEILPDREIMAEISLYLNSETEPPVYREIQECRSNSYGIFNLTVGQGTPLNDGLITDFSQIDWLSGSYVLKVRADFGTNEFLSGMQELGSYKLLSVPYAFSADRAAKADSLTGDIALNLEDLNNVYADSPAHMQLIAWDADNERWILSDPGGLPDIFLRRDGSTDLTGDWTIIDHSLLLQNGDMHLENGRLTAYELSGLSGTVISNFSDDILLSDSSNVSVPTESAVKAYVDNSAASGPWNADAKAVFMREEKKLGIGTLTPTDKFHLQLATEEGFLVSGAYGGAIPDLNAGTRMTFYPAKGAFRAGGLQNQPDYWNNASVGNYSAAFGYDIEAAGDYAFTAGRDNMAFGAYTAAFGRENRALTNYSFSAGRNNSSGALYSSTFGYSNSVSGMAASAFGQENSARGDYSFAVGLSAQTGKADGTKGKAAFAAGEETKAEGDGSFTSGKSNLVEGDYSVAGGEANYTSSGGIASAVFGKDNRCEGNYSFAAGSQLIAKSYTEAVFGQYNTDSGGSASSWVSGEPLFVVGNGTDAANRSNAFIVLKDGKTGIATGTAVPTVALQVGTAGDGSKAIADKWEIHSDRRLKRDIQPIDSASQKLSHLNGYYFYWDNKKDTSRQVGLIAQEVEKLFPELVSEQRNGYKTLNYSVLTAVLIQAFNEQQSEFEKLKAENKQMKARIERLEQKNEEILEYIKAEANIKMIKE